MDGLDLRLGNGDDKVNWVRDFTAAHQPNPLRNLEDAPAQMRQELVDVFFGIAEQSAGAVPEDRLHRTISQSLGVAPAGNPYGGYRYAIGRDIARQDLQWPRVYDLLGRLWPVYEAAGLQQLYRESINRVLAAYGAAWELSEEGRIQRVMPIAAQAQIQAAIIELTAPNFAPALALMKAARDAYDDRPRRDRDAAANAFDALESVAKIIYELPTATFSQVVDEVQRNAGMNEHVIATLRALNTLRNRTFGHGMAVPFRLTPAEVDFVYLMCIGAILSFVRH